MSLIIATGFLFSNTYHAFCSSNDGNHLYYSKYRFKVQGAGNSYIPGVAVFPSIIGSLVNIASSIIYFFGGTALLILVGLVLDTMKHIESQPGIRTHQLTSDDISRITALLQEGLLLKVICEGKFKTISSFSLAFTAIVVREQGQIHELE
ncbi:hypothetical protein ACTFIW_012129 [Dictyostelium discoideum]